MLIFIKHTYIHIHQNYLALKYFCNKKKKKIPFIHLLDQILNFILFPFSWEQINSKPDTRGSTRSIQARIRRPGRYRRAILKRDQLLATPSRSSTHRASSSDKNEVFTGGRRESGDATMRINRPPHGDSSGIAVKETKGRERDTLVADVLRCWQGANHLRGSKPVSGCIVNSPLLSNPLSL